MISIHTPHAGSDTKAFFDRLSKSEFQSTLPMRGATTMVISFPLTPGYFNPHSPCGERLAFLISLFVVVQFQSTLPMRGATGIDDHIGLSGKNFNPHSPCGERPYTRYIIGKRRCISIHTPHAGSDGAGHTMSMDIMNFNPHSPCGERRSASLFIVCDSDFNPHSPCGERPEAQKKAEAALQFQSTLPMRGATSQQIG